ncbi:MAG: hypothetical protein V4598_00585 [Bdellovibrionota bacterium]
MTKFFIFLLVISCSALPKKEAAVQRYEAKRAEFLGYWKGEVPTKDGKFMKWLIERRLDGTFTLTHLMKNSPQDPVKFDPDKATFELGIWGVSGDIYFTATRQYFENKKIANLDVTEAGLYDAYKIVSFDGTTFVYRALETGEEFTVRKIPKGTPVEL